MYVSSTFHSIYFHVIILNIKNSIKKDSFRETSKSLKLLVPKSIQKNRSLEIIWNTTKRSILPLRIDIIKLFV